jgi:hypothetical protein
MKTIAPLVNNEWERMRKKAVVAQFEALSLNFPAECEK